MSIIHEAIAGFKSECFAVIKDICIHPNDEIAFNEYSTPGELTARCMLGDICYPF